MLQVRSAIPRWVRNKICNRLALKPENGNFCPFLAQKKKNVNLYEKCKNRPIN